MATALITGSYGGLGSCFARIHAERGGALVLVGRSEKRLAEQKKDLAGCNVCTETIAADLAAPDAAGYVHEEVRRRGIFCEYLINNAGAGGQGDFARERSMEEDMGLLALNIETPTRLLKLFLPDMIARGTGRVLNVSSTAALLPGPLQAVYYAAKAYLTSLSEALWRELEGTGVSVTALMPGAMDTGFADASGLSDTKLFLHPASPEAAARAGYEGMLHGKLAVMTGAPGIPKPLTALAPLLPRKAMLNYVYDQQRVRK